ncbi:MAG: hypothetical protein J6B87_06220 [Clostridia bacterium]|nr:hypothetical protein [Clostridia bacterium]
MAIVIKEIARKLANGSYEQVSLGAMANNVKLTNGSSVETEINNLKAAGGVSLVDLQTNIEEIE